jgi:hypothetical protein
MTISVSYTTEQAQNVKHQLIDDSVEVSKVYHHEPLHPVVYRLLINPESDRFGLLEVLPDGPVGGMYYGDKYALISPQLNNFEELRAHLIHSGNEVLTMSADNETLRLRLRTDDAGDDIDVIATTSPSQAYVKMPDIFYCTDSMSDEIEEIERKERERLDQMAEAF